METSSGKRTTESPKSNRRAVSAELVFFQHDEIIVHTPAELAASVAQTVHQSAETARRLLFGDAVVRFPLDVSTVDCYADAKG